MPSRSRASRRKFLEYRRDARQGLPATDNGQPPGHGEAKDGKSRHRSFWQLFRRFLDLLADQRRPMCLALATLTISTLLTLVPPASTKLVIDYVLPGKPLPVQWTDRLNLPAGGFPLLLVFGAAVVGVSLAARFLHLWSRYLATVVTKRVQIAMRHEAFEHAVRLPLHRVYQLKSGGVASILREDAGGVAELVFSMLYNPWRAIIQLIGSLAVLAWVDWRLLLGSLIVVPAVYLSHRTWINRIRPMYREIRRQRQEVDSHTTEAFGGMRIVRAFGRSRTETGRFARAGHLMARHEVFTWWWSRVIELAWGILIPVASAGLLLYGGSEVLAGRMSTGDLMMFLVYLTMLLEPLAVLAESATQFQTNLAGFDRMLDLLAEPSEMPSRPGSIRVEPATVSGHLALRDVTFRYPGSPDLVLNNVNLDVPPGQVVALVGPSGAGKTTLCNLVARFYDPTSGSVELDGIDLRDIDVESYRRLLGIVEQDIFLFDGTIAENIGYAGRHVTHDQLERAARVANAHDFILALPDGYDTVVGERGVRLSGGQRQRLAIARAVLADPRIFILDEATSNLDTESERLIQQSLHVLMRSRTSFVIAHRLSTIVHADRIVVLADGEIVESGTHDELMSRSGRYREMVHMQMGPDGQKLDYADVDVSSS